MTRPSPSRTPTRPLPLSGLDLALVDDAADVWVLRRPGDAAALRYVAGTGPDVLQGGWVVRRRSGDTALALGHLPEVQRDLRVRFTCARLRWRVEATVPPVPLTDRLWVAEAQGDFDLAVLEADGEPLTAVRLSLLR